MAGVSSCTKYSMFFFTVIFWVCGFIILAASIWVLVNKSLEEFNTDNKFLPGVHLLIAVGAIIMVLGILGYCGAKLESQCMLILFFIGLLLLLLLQVIAGILGAECKSKLDSTINITIHEKLEQLKTNATFQVQFREFEKQFKCCGLINKENDWLPNATVKDGCVCLPEDVGTSHCPSGGQNKYIRTCKTVITGSLDKPLTIIIGIAFGLAFIEILGLVFSMCLCCQIQRK
uniref:tetraspanin-8 n=1 Tax=Euleptes europaea TaxID=460621 RepID=UPI002541A78C|nr:tetraspanin-8 [Euleptes europaea]